MLYKREKRLVSAGAAQRLEWSPGIVAIGQVEETLGRVDLWGHRGVVCDTQMARENVLSSSQ